MIAVLTILDNEEKGFTIQIAQNNRILYEGNLNNENIFYDILSLRLDYVYVWEAPILFAFMDVFANKKQLKNYDTLKQACEQKYMNVTDESISYKDGLGVYFQRKLWLRTNKANSTDRHKRLSSTAFINLSNYFGGKELTKILEAFNITEKNKAKATFQLLQDFNEFIKTITGLNFIKSTGAPISWSMGGIAKRFYLKLYAPSSANPQKEYTERNPQNKAIEYELREANLLLPGILYLKDTLKHSNLFKFDKNSLFPFAERRLPFFSVPREATFEEWQAYIYSSNYSDFPLIPPDTTEFILIFDNLELKLKKGFPAIFKEPGKVYKGKNSKRVFLDKQAFFGVYLNMLLNFYDINDFTAVKVYKMRCYEDKAINNYVEHLYQFKVNIKNGTIQEYGLGLYSTVKFLINNLHGKFAQLTLNEEYDYNLNAEGVITKTVKRISDNWKNSHFDYIRGAYVYALSQVLMLHDLLKLSQKVPDNLANHVFYMDTDCIITDIAPVIFARILEVDSVRLGAYKIENKYSVFQAYAPKVYAGYDNGNFCLTTAGLKAKEIKEYLNEKIYSWAYLEALSNNNFLVPSTYIKRTPNGCKRVTEFKPITSEWRGNEEGDVIE